MAESTLVEGANVETGAPVETPKGEETAKRRTRKPRTIMADPLKEGREHEARVSAAEKFGELWRAYQTSNLVALLEMGDVICPPIYSAERRKDAIGAFIVVSGASETEIKLILKLHETADQFGRALAPKMPDYRVVEAFAPYREGGERFAKCNGKQLALVKELWTALCEGTELKIPAHKGANGNPVKAFKGIIQRTRAQYLDAIGRYLLAHDIPRRQPRKGSGQGTGEETTPPSASEVVSTAIESIAKLEDSKERGASYAAAAAALPLSGVKAFCKGLPKETAHAIMGELSKLYGGK